MDRQDGVEQERTEAAETLYTLLLKTIGNTAE
jgi:hypothetical protein